VKSQRVGERAVLEVEELVHFHVKQRCFSTVERDADLHAHHLRAEDAGEYPVDAARAVHVQEYVAVALDPLKISPIIVAAAPVPGGGHGCVRVLTLGQMVHRS